MHPPSSSAVDASNIERRTWAFASLLGAVTPDVFRREYWGKQWLHVQRTREDFYDGLITLDEIERYLSMPEAFSRHSVATPRHGYGIPEPPPASLGEACERVMDGSSLRIRRMECFLDPAAPIMSLVRDMIATLQHPLESLSCYVARAGAAGLGPHHDETEIFTLQIAGRKRWRLYHRAGRIGAAGVYDAADLGEPACELTLQPGDLLYTPRGLIHDVGAEAGSFSITIVFDPFTWRSILDVLSARLAATEPFQETLPAGALLGQTADAVAPDFRDRMDRVRQALDTLDAAEFVDSLAETFVSRLTWPPGTTHLAAALDAGTITLDTAVERNVNVVCHLARHGDRVRLTLAGGYTIQASARAEPALRAVLAASAPFLVADIHHSLGDAAKIAIARKLVASGVLRPLARESA